MEANGDGTAAATSTATMTSTAAVASETEIADTAATAADGPAMSPSRSASKSSIIDAAACSAVPVLELAAPHGASNGVRSPTKQCSDSADSAGALNGSLYERMREQRAAQRRAAGVEGSRRRGGRAPRVATTPDATSPRESLVGSATASDLGCSPVDAQGSAAGACASPSLSEMHQLRERCVALELKCGRLEEERAAKDLAYAKLEALLAAKEADLRELRAANPQQ